MNIVEIKNVDEIKELINKIIVIEDESKRMKVIDPKFIKIISRTFKVVKGNKIETEMIREQMDVADAVVILPISSDNKIIFVIQVRPQTKEKVLLELPAGYVNSNEDISVSAIRELNEETGVILNYNSEVIKVSTYLQDQGKSESYNHSYLITNVTEKKSQSLDSDEVIPYVIKCDIKLAYEFLDSGLIKDANSRLVLLELKDKLLNSIN